MNSTPSTEDTSGRNHTNHGFAAFPDTCRACRVELMMDEPIEVQAAYHHLSKLGVTLWGEWLIDDPTRRLRAARWAAALFKDIESVLRDPTFQPQ